MFAYLDESGDLGWTLDAPFRHGGSSRFLTIGIMTVPKDRAHVPKRLVKNLYRHTGCPAGQELKAAHLNAAQREWFANKIATLCEREQTVKLMSITVRKENVQWHLRDDPNKLYNFMIRLSLLEHISAFPAVEFIPDKRTIKVASGNSLADYLQIYLWYEMNALTRITNHPQESSTNLNLQFVDFLANFIWRKHELNDSMPFNILRHHVVRKTLFF